MKIETIPIKELKPYAKNNKKHPAEQVKKIADSIKEFGFNVPIIINKDNYIIAGHGRLEASKQLDLQEVPCIKLENLSEDQIRAYRIMDNKSAESDWDMDFLKEELKLLQDNDFNMDLTGFDQPELDELFPEWQEDDELKDAEPEDATRVETTIKRGNVILLGNHRLMCGDSTSSEDVGILMQNEKADMVLTDPPYGINEKGDRSNRGGLGKGGLAKACKYESFIDDSIEYAVKAFKLCEYIPIQVWWGANYYAHHIPQSNNWLVWDKRVEEKQRDTQSDCELAWVKNNHSSVRIFRHLWKGMMKDSERGQSRVHPTQKPIELMAHCIKSYAPDSKIVLDLFGGSGSTLIAAENLNRKCLMMELDTQYCEVICRRWEKLTGKKRQVI